MKISSSLWFTSLVKWPTSRFFTLWSLLDKLGLELLFEGFGFVIFKTWAWSRGTSLFGLFPTVSELSSFYPALFGHSNLSFVLNITGLWNREFRLLFPLLIGLLTFFLLWHFILLILLPDEILLSLVPNSLLFFLLYVLVLHNILHLVSFDFRQRVKLSLIVWILNSWNKLVGVTEIFLHWLLLFVVKFDFNTINQTDWHFLSIETLSVLLKLFNLIFCQDLLPFARVICLKFFSFLLLCQLESLLFTDFFNRSEEVIIFRLFLLGYPLKLKEWLLRIEVSDLF